MGEAVKKRGTRRGAERVGDKEEERTPRSPLEESPWARVPLIIIRSNSKRERRKETVRQEGKGGKRREREERRISSLRFDRVGVDRRLIDSPPRHGNFFEEPAGLPSSATPTISHRAPSRSSPFPPSRRIRLL